VAVWTLKVAASLCSWFIVRGICWDWFLTPAAKLLWAAATYLPTPASFSTNGLSPAISYKSKPKEKQQKTLLELLNFEHGAQDTSVKLTCIRKPVIRSKKFRTIGRCRSSTIHMMNLVLQLDICKVLTACLYCRAAAQLPSCVRHGPNPPPWRTCIVQQIVRESWYRR
jgi:hypothetical protein